MAERRKKSLLWLMFWAITFTMIVSFWMENVDHAPGPQPATPKAAALYQEMKDWTDDGPATRPATQPATRPAAESDNLGGL